MNSKIRLDPISGAFDLRVYADSGDSSVPLSKEMREYTTVGRVIIAGETAVVTGVHGGMSDKEAWADFDEVMRSRGVAQVLWERHKNGKILMKKRYCVKRK